MQKYLEKLISVQLDLTFKYVFEFKLSLLMVIKLTESGHLHVQGGDYNTGRLLDRVVL